MMPLRKLLILSICAALCLSLALALAVRLGRGGAADTGPDRGAGGDTYAYVTEREVVLMRGERTVARVRRLFDAADPADYQVVWTHSGDYLAFYSDARVRREDTSQLQLVSVNASTGAVHRARCADCGTFTPVGRNSILARGSAGVFRFDLDKPGPGSPIPAPLTTAAGRYGQFLVSSPEHVITSQYEGNNERLDLMKADGSAPQRLGSFDSNDYMPAAVSRAGTESQRTFAVAFRTNPGLCGPFPIYVFGMDGTGRRTDMSRVTRDDLTAGEYGLQVNDLWWGLDGHFHAAIEPLVCKRDSENVYHREPAGPSSVWRLDDAVWVEEKSGAATMQRALGTDVNAVLVAHDCGSSARRRESDAVYCNSGVLYRERDGERTVVADDVLSISAPTPQSR
jgi:hypothetical protein